MWYICLHLYRILVCVVNIINKLADDYVFGIVRNNIYLLFKDNIGNKVTSTNHGM